MIRRAVKPRRRASSRYSSTTTATSRGGTECRSKTSPIGIRMGSIKPRRPDRNSGRATGLPYYAHLTLSDLLPVLAHDRFHLILQVKLVLLQPRFFQFLIICQVGKRFE